jgi:hypothetical protein
MSVKNLIDLPSVPPALRLRQLVVRPAAGLQRPQWLLLCPAVAATSQGHTEGQGACLGVGCEGLESIDFVSSKVLLPLCSTQRTWQGGRRWGGGSRSTRQTQPRRNDARIHQHHSPVARTRASRMGRSSTSCRGHCRAVPCIICRGYLCLMVVVVVVVGVSDVSNPVRFLCPLLLVPPKAKREPEELAKTNQRRPGPRFDRGSIHYTQMESDRNA